MTAAPPEIVDLASRPPADGWGWDRLPLATAEDHRALRRSAVLVLASPTPSAGLAVLLLRRSQQMRHHPGELAFPGGGIETGEDTVTAALRECREETGMAVAAEQVLGSLPPLHLMASRNVVTPVLAWSPVPARGSCPAPIDHPETESCHWVTRRDPVDPDRRLTVDDGLGFSGPGFLVPAGLVWGFTANVLDWMLREAGWERPWDRSRHRSVGRAAAITATLPGADAPQEEENDVRH